LTGDFPLGLRTASTGKPLPPVIQVAAGQIKTSKSLVGTFIRRGLGDFFYHQQITLKTNLSKIMI
jgi:hypothetical protein